MNILTFDIEDWFHINFNKSFNDEKLWQKFESRIQDNTDVLLDLLDEHKVQATFFILGWVARKHPGVVKEINNRGHDIGSHSDLHNLVLGQDHKEFEEDLKRSIESLESLIGKKVTLFRAPAFSIGRKNLWAFEILAKNGILTDCSIFPAKHDFGGFPELNEYGPFIIDKGGIEIRELPMSVYGFFGRKMIFTGGGYFRFFPLKWIQYALKDAEYNMFYFHPRDFDSGQPILEGLSFKRRLLSYIGLKHSLEKFTRLVKSYKFISVSQAEDIIQWEKVQKVRF